MEKKYILLIILGIIATSVILALLFLLEPSVDINKITKENMKGFTSPDLLSLEDGTEYTRSTKTTCKDGICNLILYSGIKNVYEDDVWKRVEDARSLVGSGVECIVKSDGEHIVKCLDWNYTSIKLDVSINSVSISDKEVPITIYEWVYDEKEDKDVLTLKYTENETFSLSNNKKEKQLPSFEYGNVIHFGEESTEVILQDANTENLGDSFFRSSTPDTNFGTNVEIFLHNLSSLNAHAYIQFNISQIPVGNQIDEAILRLYINSNGLDAADEGYNVSTYMIYQFPAFNLSGIPINETNITWNTRPQSSLEFNWTYTDSIKFFGGTGEPVADQYWNVKEMMAQAYSDEDANLSIYIRTHDQFDGGIFLSGDDIDVDSKESATSANRPFLNITYSEAAPPGDSCSPTFPLTGDHNFDCGDDCVLNGSRNCNGFGVSIGGSGTFRFNGTLSNFSSLQFYGGCEIICKDTYCHK